ncbi:hypothetical protein NIES4103_29150 [Nostoc sp. NIES-4103]|nr:hypothetical protein NIES4103_29150 [Nostoc sp. NIES-4103]
MQSRQAKKPTNAPQQGMLQERSSLAVQPKKSKTSQQPDLKTSLMQAEQYGHHLHQMHSGNQSSLSEASQVPQPISTHTKTSINVSPIQRACRAPGCNDSNCHDESNHGFDAVRPMRDRTVYSSTVNPTDLGQGTGTTQGTRNYVNSISYPQQVSMSYSNGSQGGHTEFENAPLRSGQRADAGHIRGQQNGGYGNQNAAVFPQNPQQNRGNHLNGQPTRAIWREHEDNIRNLTQGGQPTRMAVTLREQPRKRYS